MKAKKRLRIATRKSALAICQAKLVKNQLQVLHPGLEIEMVPLVSQGDRLVDVPLNKMGGKGLFTKELEYAILDNRADIAVHSMKDLSAELPEGLEVAVICEREDPRDAFISNSYTSLYSLPERALVGTSSVRRQSQLLKVRSDCKTGFLRGNIDTRLKRLDEGRFDAIILAAAGLIRLDMQHRVTNLLSVDHFLPACGQGAIGIECRSSDEEIRMLIAPLHHSETAHCVLAERAMLKMLQGSCQTPVACYAVINGDLLTLRGMVAMPDASQVVTVSVQGARDCYQALGEEGAERLIASGAGEILAQLQY